MKPRPRRGPRWARGRYPESSLSPHLVLLAFTTKLPRHECESGGHCANCENGMLVPDVGGQDEGFPTITVEFGVAGCKQEESTESIKSRAVWFKIDLLYPGRGSTLVRLWPAIEVEPCFQFSDAEGPVLVSFKSRLVKPCCAVRLKGLAGLLLSQGKWLRRDGEWGLRWVACAGIHAPLEVSQPKNERRTTKLLNLMSKIN